MNQQQSEEHLAFIRNSLWPLMELADHLVRHLYVDIHNRRAELKRPLSEEEQASCYEICTSLSHVGSERLRAMLALTALLRTLASLLTETKDGGIFEPGKALLNHDGLTFTENERRIPAAVLCQEITQDSGLGPWIWETCFAVLYEKTDRADADLSWKRIEGKPQVLTIFLTPVTL